MCGVIHVEGLGRNGSLEPSQALGSFNLHVIVSMGDVV